MMDDLANIAKGLTKAQRDMISGRYDPEFASVDDAAMLERLGLWKWEGPTEDEEFYHFCFTPLGAAVRSHLKDHEHG